MSHTKQTALTWNRLSIAYMMLVIAIGAVCLFVSVVNLPVDRIDLNFAILAALTLGLGSRITVPIPRFKSHISVSDTFIFLTLLLYGAEAAIILAAIEAFLAAHRFCSKYVTVVFNASVMAISTTAVVLVLRSNGLFTEDKLHGHPNNFGDFLMVLSVLAVVQFLVNTALASAYDALKGPLPFWETWKTKYIWTFLTYLVGAAGAGTALKLVDVAGFAVMFSAVPIIFFVFYGYRMYLRNVEMSIDQADQAREYANALKERSNALRESEERFRSAFDHAPIGIALVSPAGKWLKTNRAMSRILGYSFRELKSMHFQTLLAEEDLGPALIHINEVVCGKIHSYQAEQRYIHKNGSTVWASWSVSAASQTHTENSNLIFQIQDITERKLAEEKLQHEATHDSLTALPNRAHFMSRLSEALKKGKQDPKYKVCVLFIDLDRFKYVNDSLGHFIGDQLLIEIADRLRESMRPPDIVARLGGDEFIVLVEGRYYMEKVTRIADRIQKKLTEPFEIQGHEVYSSASIGILQANEQHKTSEDIMRDADTAMYHAKRSGKARHETFNETMRTAVRETLKLETDLRRAIQNDDFKVFFQPIFSLETNEITGAEALARWDHPELGVIPPSKFVPLAEEIGWIDKLGEQILERACREMMAIYDEIMPDFPIKLSVNLSCKQFAKTNVVKRIEQILTATDFPPSHLKLEITESVFFEYQERAIGMLHRLCDLGIEMDIDDFGTGYSNLSYLVQLPLSTLKIDKSFVSPINEDGANTEIVRTIIAMARNLNLGVVAEGIETNAQLQALKSLGCERGQGYLLARPMNNTELRDFFLERTAIAMPQADIDDVSIVSVLQ